MTEPNDLDDSAPGALPTFQNLPEDTRQEHLSDQGDPGPDPTSPGDAPQTTPPGASPGPSQGQPGPQSRPRTSSRTSTELPGEATEALAGVFTGLAELAGLGLNRATRRRDDRWLLTDDEATGLGDALSRIAARRIPEELIEEENGDLFTVGAITVGYGMRNLMGVTASDVERAKLSRDVIDPRREAPGPAPARADDPDAAAAGARVLTADDVDAVDTV